MLLLLMSFIRPWRIRKSTAKLRIVLKNCVLGLWRRQKRWSAAEIWGEHRLVRFVSRILWLAMKRLGCHAHIFITETAFRSGFEKANSVPCVGLRCLVRDTNLSLLERLTSLSFFFVEVKDSLCFVLYFSWFSCNFALCYLFLIGNIGLNIVDVVSRINFFNKILCIYLWFN